MPPVKKVGIDKAAWAWAEFVDPDKITIEHVETAYRLNLPKCPVGSCRRNCKRKPFCLSGLGESKWMTAASTKESEEEDFEFELRKPNSFVGLKNLGATCYINSLLQLWFHNLTFRNAILKWNPKEDVTEGIDFDETGIKPPISVIGHLQFLFTVMQFGNKSSVDPTEFIKALDIEPDTQQDAHEFLQLFSCYLEENLRHQSNPIVKNIVKNNFQGEYNYVTRCSSCQTESIRQSTFYELELNVKGHKTLDNCLVEFLKEEKLEGSDKYLCSICNSKQEAARRILLTVLPPVLNLYLMRFIYDREKGQKKKVNTCVQFPEKIDMSPYVGATTPIIYNLSAVLIHKGPSAYSGHYVAHICDRSNGNWYMFNDESASKMEGKIPKLTPDDNDYEEDGKKVKQSRPVKGFLSSSNAYLLVYSSEKGLQEKPITREELQSHLSYQLDNYNALFESLLADNKATKLSEKEDENLKKAEMLSFFNTLPVKDNWEAISVKWLTNWLAAGDDKFYPVDNTKLLCSHNKLNFNSIPDLKLIDSAAADVVFEKYGGGPRLSKDSLCWECVKNRCKDIRIKVKITEDQKEITNLLKSKIDNDAGGFWVGRNSLRSWKKKALRSYSLKDNDEEGNDSKIETDSSPTHFDDNEENGEYCHQPKKMKLGENEETTEDTKKSEDNDSSKTNGVKSEDEEEDNEEFNDDAACEHGNLIFEEAKRRLVSESVWSRLRFYFPNCKEFPKGSSACSDCQTQFSRNKVVKDMEKQQAAREKELLGGLYYKKSKVFPNQGKFYVVSFPDFLDPWKKFIRGMKGERPQSLNNSILMCSHEKLLYNPNNTDDFNKMALLSEEEWNVLKEEYSSDKEIILNFDEGKVASSTPEVCEECIQGRLAAEQQALLNYNMAKIYIRQKKDEEPMDQAKDKQELRRSNRKRISGEKTMKVSSTQTLMDLKLQILNLMAVAPFDQHLSTEDGRELVDHKATLSSLNVYPNSIIYLKIDEVTNNPLEDYIPTTEPEHGFKGTCLLKR